MNILLINPQSRIFSYNVPPLGILYIASMLRTKGYHKISIKNVDTDRLGSVRNLLLKINPDIVGVSAMAFTYRDALNILKLVKRTLPSVFTVIGGIHPTNLPEECVKEKCCDCAVIGEGEETFCELAEEMEGRRGLSKIPGIAFKKNGSPQLTPPRQSVINIDNIPFPAYDLIDIKPYAVSLHHTLITSAGLGEPILPVVGSRGCCYNCIFCNLDVWNNRLRMRSPNNILAELKFLYSNYKMRRFHFLDGLFTVNPERTKKLCKLILEEGLNIRWFCGTRPDLIDSKTLSLMKEAGCELIFYGVESSSQLVLDRLNKKISVPRIKETLSLSRKSGIISFGNFIFGAPGETRATINKTISFAKRYLDAASFTVAIAFPKTGLARFIEKEKRQKPFNGWDNFSLQDIPKIIYIAKGLSYRLLNYYIYKAYAFFYLNPKIIGRFLYKIFTSRKSIIYINGILHGVKSITVALAYKCEKRNSY